MTSTVLIRLAGPLQAWGVGSRFRHRDAGTRPSKSGVIGMVAAALGRDREADLVDLAALSYAVRVDQEGSILRDFQTAQARGKTSLSYRQYIEDAVFVAALEGDDELIRQVEFALRHPVYHVFLGRKSCPPAGQLSLGVRGTGMLAAFDAEPWHAGAPRQRKLRNDEAVRLPVYRDAVGSERGDLISDVPESFSAERRMHTARYVVRGDDVTVANPAYRPKAGAIAAPDAHDPFDLI